MTAEAAKALDDFEAEWGDKYPSIDAAQAGGEHGKSGGHPRDLPSRQRCADHLTKATPSKA